MHRCSFGVSPFYWTHSIVRQCGQRTRRARLKMNIFKDYFWAASQMMVKLCLECFWGCCTWNCLCSECQLYWQDFNAVSLPDCFSSVLIFLFVVTAVSCCEPIPCPHLLPDQIVAFTFVLSLPAARSSCGESVCIYSYLLYGIAASCYPKCYGVPGCLCSRVIPTETEDKLNNDMLCSYIRSKSSVGIFTFKAANSILPCT